MKNWKQSDFDIIELELAGLELCEFCRSQRAAGGSLGVYCSTRCALNAADECYLEEEDDEKGRDNE